MNTIKQDLEQAMNDNITFSCNQSPTLSGKIEYYQAMLSNAVTDLNIEKIKFYTGKLEYFVNK